MPSPSKFLKKQFQLLMSNLKGNKPRKEPNSRRYLLLERKLLRMNSRSSAKERLSWLRDQFTLTQMKNQVAHYPIEKFEKLSKTKKNLFTT